MLIQLKLALLERGITQAELARGIRKTPARISRIIRERIKARARDRRLISRFLGVPQSKLFPRIRRARPSTHCRAKETQGRRRRR